MNQHAVEGKDFVIPIIEKLGFRLGFTVLIAHDIGRLMVGTGLIANAKSPQRAATKALEYGGRLNMTQCSPPRIGVWRKGDLFLGGRDLSKRPAKSVRRLVIR